MAFNKDRGDAPMRKRGVIRRRKKVCVFCGKETNEIDYKDVNKHQRALTVAIKRSRHVALMPYVQD